MTTREIAYRVVDVFTQTRLEGNALAVFPDAAVLDASTMQRIARELNLAETTFVLPPMTGGDLHVRIFTPAYEMTFAGHPTLGTAYVARMLGMVSHEARTIVLEERVGHVPVHFDGGRGERLWLETPRIAWREALDAASAAAALGLQPRDLIAGLPVRVLDAGNPCAFVALADRATVDRIRIDSARIRELFATRPEPTCLFAFAPVPGGAYSRMFAEELGVVEDPATGSATGPLAAFMLEHGLIAGGDGAEFVSEQGAKIGRRSLLYVRLRGERGERGIDVGGHVTPVAAATMLVDCED